MSISKIESMLLLAMLVSTFFVQCGSEPAKSQTLEAMQCNYVGGIITFHRCENEEVVCYQGETGLSCEWKAERVSQ